MARELTATEVEKRILMKQLPLINRISDGNLENQWHNNLLLSSVTNC